MYQDQYWNEVVELRSRSFYLQRLLEINQKTERTINCFLAITSSSSIAGWAIWHEYSFVWAVLIASSQVVTAVRGFLPYAVRIKNLKQASKEMNDLMIHAETRWISVANGSLTDEEVQMERLDVKKRVNTIVDKGLGVDPIPKDDAAFKYAEHEAECYFRRYYPVTQGDES